MAFELSTSSIYVGGLPENILTLEIYDLFKVCGKIINIDVVNRPNKPAWAFVTFEKTKGADRAIRKFHREEYANRALTVEPSKKGRLMNDHQLAHFGFAVYITDIPQDASWQDIKDHMKNAGHVGHARVIMPGKAVAVYKEKSDQRKALKYLDKTIIRTFFGSYSVIRVHKRDPSISQHRKSRSPVRNVSKEQHKDAHKRREDTPLRITITNKPNTKHRSHKRIRYPDDSLEQDADIRPPAESRTKFRRSKSHSRKYTVRNKKHQSPGFESNGDTVGSRGHFSEKSRNVCRPSITPETEADGIEDVSDYGMRSFSP